MSRRLSMIKKIDYIRHQLHQVQRAATQDAQQQYEDAGKMYAKQQTEVKKQEDGYELSVAHEFNVFVLEACFLSRLSAESKLQVAEQQCGVKLNQYRGALSCLQESNKAQKQTERLLSTEVKKELEKQNKAEQMLEETYIMRNSNRNK